MGQRGRGKNLPFRRAGVSRPRALEVSPCRRLAAVAFRTLKGEAMKRIREYFRNLEGTENNILPDGFKYGIGVFVVSEADASVFPELSWAVGLTAVLSGYGQCLTIGDAIFSCGDHAVDEP